MKQTQTNKIEWREVELGSLIKLRGGFAFKSSDFVKEGIPLVRISNFNNDEVDLINSVFISFEEYKKYPELQLKENDLLIAMSGATTGKVGIISKKNIPCILNQRVGKFEILSKNLNWRFLYLFIKSKNFQDEVLYTAGGCAQPNISGKKIESIKLPIPFSNNSPDLKEQERIVKILEESERLNKRGKRAEELLNEYLKSVFYEMFLEEKDESKIVELGAVTKIISGSTPSTSKKEYWDGDINWVTPAEIIDGPNFYYYETQRKITNLGIKSCSAELFPKGTVILTTRAPIGKVAIAGNEMCSNQGFKNLIPSEKINSIYLYFWLLLNKDYLNFLGHGATFKEISKKIVSGIKIPLPPLPLQQKFASIVEQIEKMKESVNKTKQNSEELFNSLVSKGFRGEL